MHRPARRGPACGTAPGRESRVFWPSTSISNSTRTRPRTPAPLSCTSTRRAASSASTCGFLDRERHHQPAPSTATSRPAGSLRSGSLSTFATEISSDSTFAAAARTSCAVFDRLHLRAGQLPAHRADSRPARPDHQVGVVPQPHRDRRRDARSPPGGPPASPARPAASRRRAAPLNETVSPFGLLLRLAALHLFGLRLWSRDVRAERSGQPVGMLRQRHPCALTSRSQSLLRRGEATARIAAPASSGEVVATVTSRAAASVLVLSSEAAASAPSRLRPSVTWAPA